MLFTPLTPTAAAHKARLMDEALAADAKLDRLVALIGVYRAARIKEAQQACTLKCSGMIARSQAEYDILGLIEDVFLIDTDDACEAIADECLSECNYDVRQRRNPVEDAADFADYLYDFAMDAVMVAQYEARPAESYIPGRAA